MNLLKHLVAAGRRIAALALLSTGAIALTPALAHKPSDSYLTLSVAESRITGRWDIALRDLDFAIGLDANGDGNITWGETRARHADMAAYALARLNVLGDGQPCSTHAGEQLVDTHTDGSYTVLAFSVQCPHAPAAITLTYRLFSDLDPQHRGLLSLEANGANRSAVLGPQSPTQQFVLADTSRWSQFADYLREGVWHIWIGFDHILFLLSLLLPAVLVWQHRRWQPAPRFRTTFWDVAKVVTAFTVAHSITLSLATLGVITLPTRWVESVIAASVVVAALNNVFGLVHGRLWVMAFGFGLIHGFGFASVLADLGLPQGTLLLALVAFNLGVEAGQLAIVAVFLPLAFALRRTWFYRKLVLVGGSLLIAALASVWLAERLFNFKLLPF
ncbi:MAG: hypothetical protein RLZZ618_679 [Pseudomonadota bacterium]|jgi:hypothetical protein